MAWQQIGDAYAKMGLIIVLYMMFLFLKASLDDLASIGYNANAHIALVALLRECSVCESKFNLRSSVTPMYLTVVAASIVLFWNRNGIDGNRLLGRLNGKMINCVGCVNFNFPFGHKFFDRLKCALIRVPYCRRSKQFGIYLSIYSHLYR